MFCKAMQAECEAIFTAAEIQPIYAYFFFGKDNDFSLQIV